MTPPADTATLAEAYAALRDGAPPVAVAGRVALIWVEGPDAAHFLHGLLTNDVAGMAPGDALMALLLDDKGHIVADTRVHRDGEDAFTLVLRPALADTVAATLEHYHFSEDLDLLGPEPAETLTLAEGAAPPDGPWVPGLVPGTVERVVDDPQDALDRLGAQPAPAEALEAVRLERGAVVIGVDTGERTLVQEAALQDRAVSFTKGCYLGQETVARAQHRGRVNRVVRGLSAAAPLPVGAGITWDGRGVGTVTSAVVHPELGPIALAIVRREVPPGGEVQVQGLPGTATIREVPFT